MAQIPAFDLPPFDPARTSFLLTSATSAFEDQADRLPIFQISALLIHGGVPTQHIWVDLPIVPNQTVDGPRAHPDCRKLHLPPGLDQVYVREGSKDDAEAAAGMSQWGHVRDFFRDQNADPAVEKLVWVYLNHGKAEGIYFPVKGGIRCFSPSELAGVLQPFARKPTLIILDACYSGRFASRTLGALPATYSAPLAFLTASDAGCDSSALVLSPVFTDRLPSRRVRQSGSPDEAEVNYRVGHPMFTRGWLREFTYGDPSLRLADVPRMLNEPPRGFAARYRTKSPQMENACVGHFFPPPVDEDVVVRGYGEHILFGEMILPEGLGRLYDDRDPDLWPPFRGGASPFVVLSSTELEVLRDRSPGSRAVLMRDFLFDDIRDLLREVRHRDARQNERGDESQAAGFKPSYHMPLRAVISAIVPTIKKAHPEREFDQAVCDNPDLWPPGLIAAVTKLNGDDPREGQEEGMLAGWAFGLDVPDVMELVIHARRRYARYYRLPLEESLPDFGRELNDALRHLELPSSTPD
jgi:hypothetical protein